MTPEDSTAASEGQSSGPRTKAGRLVHTALTLDETVENMNVVIAHVDSSLRGFDDALDRFGALLVRFGEVLERFSETVEGVDTTVDKVEVITNEMGEIVGEVGGLVATMSPAFGLSEQFRRQIARVRNLGGAGGPESKDEPGPAD